MYHSILSSITKSVDDEFLTHLTFRTQDIKEVSIQRDGAGVPVKGWLTLDSVCEGENYVMSVTKEHHPTQLEMLVVLDNALQSVQPYFEDEQGNIFPFDQVLYVSKATNTAVMAGNVKVVFDPQKEMPAFLDLYRNWMDLHK